MTEKQKILQYLHTWDIENIELAIMLAKGQKIDISNEIQGMLKDFSFLKFPNCSVVIKIALLMKQTELDCGNNNLTSLPPSIGHLTNLTRLYCRNNKLTELPSSIGQLTD